MRNPLAVRAALGAALALCLVAGRAPAEDPVINTPQEVRDRAAVEFRDLEKLIRREATERKDLANLPIYLKHLKTTEDTFNAQVEAKIKNPPYDPWEFSMMNRQIGGVIAPSIRDAIATWRNGPSNGTPMDENKFNLRVTGLVTKNAFAMQAAVGEEIRRRPALLAQMQATYLRRHPEAVQGAPLPNFQGLMMDSPVVKLGVESAKPKPTPTPDPVVVNPPVSNLPPVTPGAVVPIKPGTVVIPNGGDQTTGNGTTTGDGTANAVSGDPYGGFAASLGSSSGISQLVANAGVDQLQSHDYNAAYLSAKQALGLDPKNRTALEVLRSAEGRADAAEAGAASLAAARGAGSFGPDRGPQGPASFGAAQASPEIAAAARAGATRVAADQAIAAAKTSLSLGEPESAVATLTKALAADPTNPTLLLYRSTAYARLGRYEESLADARAALAGAPTNVPLLNAKAFAENRLHRYKEARETSDLALLTDPKSALAYANRAHAEAGLGQREAMLADIRQAESLDPRFAQAAVDAAALQLPSDADVMFLFPGETRPGAAASAGRGAAAPRSRTSTAVVATGVLGGVLLALGLLSVVMGPLKDSVTSVFTRRATGGEAPSPAPVSASAPQSSLIRGQYEISRQIGAGGMGMVYEGTDRSLGRRVAIKKMREELRASPRDRERFVIEAKTVASLHHPNVVDIYAIAEEGDDVYLVFEYVDGKTVHDLIQAQGRLHAIDALRSARETADALTYAH